MNPDSRIADLIRVSVAQIEDPELPITIDDLGMLRRVEITRVRDGDRFRVSVTVRPTFLGCPARFVIEAEIKERVVEAANVSDVEVIWESGSVWRPEDVSDVGRSVLREHGVVLDLLGVRLRCPYCDSRDLERMGTRGGALCRSLAHCSACHSAVDVMGPAKAPSTGNDPLVLPLGRRPLVSAQDPSEMRCR